MAVVTVVVVVLRAVVPVVRRAVATSVMMVVAGRRVVVVPAARPVPGGGRVRRRAVGRVSAVGGVSGRHSQVRGMRAGRRPGQQNQRGDGGDPTHGGALSC
ncbi:hypothetical protein GCM10009416_33240 [Craurococcus roseus]|uniref:Secreted protein n=1 Tax=Craurococcus roseus TaxID=77585 RepID=A0ABN1FJR2_9PROT